MATDHSEPAAAVLAKAAPPVTVSIATIAGYSVGDLVLWATLLYTLLLIIKTLWQMWRMYQDSCALPTDD